MIRAFILLPLSNLRSSSIPATVVAMNIGMVTIQPSSTIAP